MRMLTHLFALPALIASASVAAAGTITVQDYSPEAYNNLLSGGTFITDGFEDAGDNLGEGEVGPGFTTALGTFETLGGTGTGGTVRNLSGNSGTLLALRDGNTYGRVNRGPVGGRWYLDSNDTWGIGWQASNGGLFNQLSFVLTDGSDTGSFLRVLTDSDSWDQRTNGRLRNGNSVIVTVSFQDYVNSAYIAIANYNAAGTAYRTNDGFSIDGLQVGIAPVPLPAGLPLLAAGMGAFVVMRRKSKRA